MRAVKIMVAAMGGLIVVGMSLVVYGLMRTSSEMAIGDAPPSSAVAPSSRTDPFDPLALGEPAGSHIAHMTGDGRGRLILGISGGGQPDRVVVVDPATGRRLGTITLEADPYGIRSRSQ